MPFVRRAVLEKLLRDDAEWMRLLRQERVEGAAEAAAPRDRLIANQEKLIKEQQEMIGVLKMPATIKLEQSNQETEKKLGLGDIRGTLAQATGLPPERIHTGRHPLDMD